MHQSAGSTNVIELHGNLRRIICTRCHYRLYHETFEGMSELPLCPQCQAILRPDAVLYEEMLPEDALERFDLEQERGFDLVFSVGTTSIFPYVTRPVLLALRDGTPTVEINTDETPVSELVQFRLAAPAGKVLQTIVDLGSPA
jgi:NAD-dependent deacetylase